jgi:hypothetical protein
MQLLKYCLSYSIERPTATYLTSLIAETEQAIKLLNVKTQNTYRLLAKNKLKQIINSISKEMLHKKTTTCEEKLTKN